MNETKTFSQKSYVKSLRWTARILGTLLVLTSLIFIGADFVRNLSNHSGFLSGSNKGLMILTDVCFLIALAGLILALWFEGSGGLISLIGMLGVVILILNNPTFNASPLLFILLLPSLLYLLYWWLSKKSNRKT